MIERQNRYLSRNTLRELIRDNNMLLMVLSRFNIPFGFGDSTVAQICATHNVDCDTFLAVCNLLSTGEARAESVRLDSLINYLKKAHSSFLEVTLPRIREHLIEAISHSTADEVSYLLIKFYDDYVEEVKRHMDYENEVIFTYAEGLLDGRPDSTGSISDFNANHGHMASKLQELKDIFIYHYNHAENARLSLALFDIINCEKDLMAHFEVENKLFVPAVEMLERTKGSGSETAAEEKSQEATSPVELLGEREKEILSWVAKGKSNKEIASELFISVHTVTTHRRNICAKLDIHSTAGLTIFAIIHNLVKIEEISPDFT